MAKRRSAARAAGAEAVSRGSGRSREGQHESEFGNDGELPLGGDWDGNGSASVGTYDGSTFKLRNALSAGAPDLKSGPASSSSCSGDVNDDAGAAWSKPRCRCGSSGRRARSVADSIAANDANARFLSMVDFSSEGRFPEPVT